MQLFQNKNNTLSSIDTDSFKLEKDIQSLVEANLQTLFGLELVSSEFAVDQFRLDSLAFDELNQAFVIIEYKKGDSYSVIDQGYSYLSVMLNNKADFILEYNEKTGKQLRRTNVDWASSRVIFVSPSFNPYQKNSVNFKDVPFELWEIKKFANNLVAIEQWEASSRESIQGLSQGSSGSVIPEVASELKVVSEEDHVSKIGISLRPVWDNLQDRLAKYADTSFSTKQKYIAWKRGGAIICYIYFYRKELTLSIVQGNKKDTGKKSKGFFTVDDPKGMVEEKVWNRSLGETRHEYYVKLKQLEDIDYVMFLLEQKYNSMA